MRFYKSLSMIFLATFLSSCGDDSEEATSEFSLNIEENKTEFQLGEQLKAQIDTNGKSLDSVVFFLGDSRLGKINGKEAFNYTFQNEKLGKWDLKAKLYNNGKLEQLDRSITLYNDTAPLTYTYEVINKYPHATDAYTQGLEFHHGELYESTGQYGESSLRKVDLQTGEVQRSIKIENNYFAEGISILDDKIYMLTWREGVGFIYDVDTFEELGQFAYGESKEGWGLANDGEKFYKSDGTEKIWILNSQTLAEEAFIQTVTNRSISTKLNELEWVNGMIYANTYQKDGVAIINPKNGAIEGVINFSGLRAQLGNINDLDPVNDVLNGIAYNPETQKLYVTGKDWDTLFEVEIKEKE
jgi:glutaminyl-peptide cyclotransferase